MTCIDCKNCCNFIAWITTSAVARLLEVSPNTERDYRLRLQAHGVLQGDPKQLPELLDLQKLVRVSRPPPSPPPSALDGYRAGLQKLLSRGKQPQAIYDELRQKHPALLGKRRRSSGCASG